MLTAYRSSRRAADRDASTSDFGGCGKAKGLGEEAGHVWPTREVVDCEAGVVELGSKAIFNEEEKRARASRCTGIEAVEVREPRVLRNAIGRPDDAGDRRGGRGAGVEGEARR